MIKNKSSAIIYRRGAGGDFGCRNKIYLIPNEAL